MSNYAKLCCFIYEEIDEIIRSMKKEVVRTENLKLKRYWLDMRRMQLDMEELELNMLESGNPPDRESVYFKMFNLITEMEQKMEEEQELFLIKKYMIALQRIQVDAEEMHLEE